MQELFTYRRDGLTDDGKVIGSIQATGIRPRFADRLKNHGFKLSADLFEPAVEH
jgi:pilus assembly protein CpaF